MNKRNEYLKTAILQYATSVLQLVDSVKSNNINTKSSTLFQQRMCTDNDGVQSFVLAWPNETGNNKQIVLTQRDIR